MIFMLLSGGLLLLVAGAELLVRGASGLAVRLGVSPLVIGLTVVAFGTSMPELAVSVQAALAGNAALSLGNVAGSNMFNLLLILGISGLIIPLVVSLQVVRIDAPIMAAGTVLLLVLGADGILGRFDGTLLFTFFLSYTLFALVRKKTDSCAFSQTVTIRHGITVLLFFVLAGIALLVSGSHLLTRGAVMAARLLGVSDLVIGLTIVAGGTSLPELAASIAATFKRQPDMAVGNVVGSNIFNILSILGLSALISPVTIAPEALEFSLPVLAVMTVFSLPFFISGLVIDRFEATILLICYVAYISVLILREVFPQAISTHNFYLIGGFAAVMSVAIMIPFLRSGKRIR